LLQHPRLYVAKAAVNPQETIKAGGIHLRRHPQAR